MKSRKTERKETERQRRGERERERAGTERETLVNMNTVLAMLTFPWKQCRGTGTVTHKRMGRGVGH